MAEQQTPPKKPVSAEPTAKPTPIKVAINTRSAHAKPFAKRGPSFGGANMGSRRPKPFGSKPNQGGFQKQSRPSLTGYEEKIVKVKKISKTTKGGRNMRFLVLVVIGDQKGQVGFGLGKSIEVPVAIRKALKNAKNNLFKIKMTKNATLYHEVIGKHCAGKVLIKPAKKGTGIIAGGPIKTVLELSGFKDVYSKNLGRNTPLNMIRAAISGLLSQRTPKEIAYLRDKELNEL